MAKDFEMGYLLDFYGEVLTPKQREMLRQYYNDDLSLSEIGENFGITRQGARDAIKHGETALRELEEKVRLFLMLPKTVGQAENILEFVKCAGCSMGSAFIGILALLSKRERSKRTSA